MLYSLCIILKFIVLRSRIYLILSISFFLRVILLLIDNFWFRLPQGGIDTDNFDIWAYNIYLYQPYTFLETISNGVYFFSSYGAVIYNLFGHKPYIWAFTMIPFGLGTIYNVYKSVLLLTQDYKAANKAAWFICFFPNMAVLSVLVLREASIHFFTSLSIFYFIKFMKKNEFRYLLLFFVNSLISTILHSGMIAVLGGFLVTILFANKKINLLSKFLVLFSVLFGLYFINSYGVGLSKFGGSFEGAIEQLGEGMNMGNNGASYPDWLILKGSLLDLWKLPVRMVAFLFAPFLPLMVRSGSHILGLIDGVFYFVLFWSIFKNKKYFNKEYNSLVIMIFAVSMLFSLGSSNFGTNIRHRTKILPIIVITAFNGRNKKKYYDGKIIV